jgi:hypothetical protein
LYIKWLLQVRVGSRFNADLQTGINCNVEGKQVRRIMRYSGGHPAFRERCEAVAANGYRELVLA